MLASSPPHHSAEKFSSATIASGLRSLLVPPSGGGVVLTRALAAATSSRGCGAGTGVRESRDGDDSGHHEDEAKAEEDDGCWVSYGRREPRRRLPPPIPSLLARDALRRTRTGDGRLVIRIAPVVWRECIRARRRLTMQLINHEDVFTLPAPNCTLLESDDGTATPTTREEGVVDGTASPTNEEEGVDEGTAAASVGSERIVNDVGEEAPVPPPRVPSAGCFEDVVFKYGSIGGTSLHRMPSLRMVH